MTNKKKIIKAWAVCSKTKNGKNIIQQNWLDEIDSGMYYVYIICESSRQAKRYNKIELDNEWEVKQVEIKL